MPVVDMPLAELKQYRGMNPKPADFDAYWDAALSEVYELPLEYELIPAQFQVPNVACFDLWFTSVNGAKIHAKYARPENAQQPHPALLRFHGYTGSSGEWSSLLAYTALGFSIAAMDCRGQGGLSQDVGSVLGTTHGGHIVRGLADSPEKLLFRSIFLDTVQFSRIVMSFAEVDENRMGAFGGSQGGALTLACAALQPKIKLAAPHCPFLCDYKRVWEIQLGERAYEEIQNYFMRFDPTHENEEEIFTRLGYIDVQNLADRIQAKVYWAVGLSDITCPPSTQFAAYNKIVSDKKMEIYPDFGHCDFPEWGDKIMQFFLQL